MLIASLRPRLHLVAAASALAAAFASPAAAQQGFADLHAHPASELAFGHAEGLCEEGIFHGGTGMSFDPAASPADIADQIASDLGTCNNATHSWCPSDIVQLEQRQAILENLESSTSHGPDGPTDYKSWPNASSVSHQQMHLAWMYRAYRGGLRLMIASVTENEMLARYYHDDGTCDGVFSPQPGFLFNSAVRQIEMLNEIDAENDWFQIVTSPEQAEDAIAGGRLAVVLGVEMDALTFDEIDRLVRDFGVRSVIPVHMVDNDFGGAAVYNDLFNSLGGWQNGGFMHVEDDPTTNFRLSRPSRLEEEPTELCALDPHCCSIQPAPIGDAEYASYGYGDAIAATGERNVRGINEPLVEELMGEPPGLLLDLAHMSWKSADQTLDVAEAYGYPVIDSHTGLRDGCAAGLDGSGHGVSERDLTYDHLARIARLGGVVGLGTVGEPPGADLVATGGWPAERLTAGKDHWRIYRQPYDRPPAPSTAINALHIRVRTGDDDLRGPGSSTGCASSTAWVIVYTARGYGQWRQLNLDDSGALTGIPAHWEHEVRYDFTTMPVGAVRSDELRKLWVYLQQPAGCSAYDRWDLDEVGVEYEGAGVGGSPRGLYVERKGAPYRTLDETTSMISIDMTTNAALPDPALRTSDFKRLDLSMQIGADPIASDLYLGVGLRNGTRQRYSMEELGFPPGFGRTAWESGAGTWTPPPGLHYGDITALWLESGDDLDDLYYDFAGVEWLQATWSDGSTVRTLVSGVGDIPGRPTFAIDSRHTTTFFRGLDDVINPSTVVNKLGYSVLTGEDNLGGTATLTLLGADGTSQSVALNPDRGIGGHSSYARRAVSIGPMLAGNIMAVEVSHPTSDDNWNVDGIKVQNLSDPALPWTQMLDTAFGVMSSLGQPAIALGTDFNGLSPQMPFAAPAGGKATTLSSLPPAFAIARDDTSTGRRFRFETDGLAHYGLLPDFVAHAIWVDPTANILLSSAQATVQTWFRARDAAARVRAGTVIGGTVTSGRCRPAP